MQRLLTGSHHEISPETQLGGLHAVQSVVSSGSEAMRRSASRRKERLPAKSQERMPVQSPGLPKNLMQSQSFSQRVHESLSAVSSSRKDSHSALLQRVPKSAKGTRRKSRRRCRVMA